MTTCARDARTLVAEVLRDLRWPEEVARELASRCHVITFVKGSRLFNAGESADLLYVLLSGEAKIYYGDAEGGRLLLDIARPRQALGYLHTPGSGGHEVVQGFSAEALSDCTVALLTRARVAAELRRLPLEATAGMVRDLSDEWGRLLERALRYLTMDVHSRLLLAIEDIGTRFGIPDARGTLIPLRLSHEDFGELIGASRPMVSKHLKQLADAGLFFKDGGRYVLARRKPAPVKTGASRLAPPTDRRRPLQAVPLAKGRAEGGIEPAGERYLPERRIRA